MLRAMRRGLETGLRRLLHGHEGGNPGYGQEAAYGLPRQFPTLPPIKEPKGSPKMRGLPLIESVADGGREPRGRLPTMPTLTIAATCRATPSVSTSSCSRVPHASAKSEFVLCQSCVTCAPTGGMFRG